MNQINWVAVKGFEGLYEISNEGVVRSLNRHVYHTGNKQEHLIQGKNLATRINNFGYVSVRLSKGGKTYTRFIHRLVALAFIPNPQNKKYINHINGIKTDNTLQNLEWCTMSENINHAYRTGLITRRNRLLFLNGGCQTSTSPIKIQDILGSSVGRLRRCV